METLQQNSDIDLKQHQQQVIGALAQEQAKAAPVAGMAPSTDDPFLGEVISAALGIGPISTFIGVVASMSSGDSISPTNNSAQPQQTTHEKKNSLFVGSGKSNATKKQQENALFVSKSAGSSPETMRRRQTKMPINASKLALTKMSLTGGSSLGGKPAPIKGIKTTPAAIKPIAHTAQLKKELDSVTNAIINPYVNNTKRLMKDLGEGVDRAEEFAAKNKGFQLSPQLKL